MIYYIDGYNLIFSFKHLEGSFQSLREKLISFLQLKFKEKHLKGLLVFDGQHKRNEESGLSYRDPLEIAYAPEGESADMYLLEKLSLEKHIQTTTLVTNDRDLASSAKFLGAKVMANSSFIKMLQKRNKEESFQKKEMKDSPKEFERLLKIFEKRSSS